MRPIDYKEKLINWQSRRDQVTPDFIGRWHLGKIYNQYPDKRALAEEGVAAITKGWLPESPIISPSTRVLAVGSCFARNFTLWLAEHGFNQRFPDSPYNALLRFNADLESPAAVAQQFRWAFDELDPSSLLWIDKERHIFGATEEGKKEVRSTLEQTDVLILTLGLSEVWYDNISGEPLWRALTEDTFDPNRHVFRVETVNKTMEWLESIERIRQLYLPNLKIVFTLSPIPLKTTFRPVSAVTANSVSKAILRAALDEWLLKHQEKVNQSLFYFPSYEIVKEYFIDPFRQDNRHLSAIVPGTIIAHFARYFCTAEIVQRNLDSLQDDMGGDAHERVMRHAEEGDEGARARELLARISDLEEENLSLQNVCDERLHVIQELDKAAKERLALIQDLDAQLKKVR